VVKPENLEPLPLEKSTCRRAREERDLPSAVPKGHGDADLRQQVTEEGPAGDQKPSAPGLFEGGAGLLDESVLRSVDVAAGV
jgi:hypothetical protein